MTTITVFCGANEGTKSNYLKAAAKLGACLAKNSITLVYGGSSHGTMGALARAALSEGGRVIGYMAQEILAREKPQNGLTEYCVEESIGIRKNKMMDCADAYIILPGGIGTMEEFFDVWSQSRFYSKPIGILNIENFYDSLLTFCKHSQREGFIPDQHILSLIIDVEPEHLVSNVLQSINRSRLTCLPSDLPSLQV